MGWEDWRFATDYPPIIERILNMATKVETNEKIEIDGKSYNVLAPCDDKNGGHWYCVSHDKGFDTQLSKDMHIKAQCRMVWICHTHGPEQP